MRTWTYNTHVEIEILLLIIVSDLRSSPFQSALQDIHSSQHWQNKETYPHILRTSWKCSTVLFSQSKQTTFNANLQKPPHEAGRRSHSRERAIYTWPYRGVKRLKSHHGPATPPRPGSPRGRRANVVQRNPGTCSRRARQCADGSGPWVGAGRRAGRDRCVQIEQPGTRRLQAPKPASHTQWHIYACTDNYTDTHRHMHKY